MTLRWRLLTPPGRPAALAALAIQADTAVELDAWLDRHHIAVRPGEALLRSLLGADDGLVLRTAPRQVILTPHGGSEIVRRLAGQLQQSGVQPAEGEAAAWPEADGEIEPRLLEALWRAPTALAIETLLLHARRWEGAEPGSEWGASRTGGAGLHPADEGARVGAGVGAKVVGGGSLGSSPPEGCKPAPPGAGEPDPALPEVPPEVARRLARLLNPPTVAIVGAPNIGKSALLNRLARRAVSVVADEPGTTRDHIGVQIDCAGLVVRMLDSPGLRAGAGAIEAEAQQLARQQIAAADLLLVCHDAQAQPAPLDLPALAAGQHRLTIATRADLAPAPPPWPADVITSARTGEGADTLARAIRDTLVPPADLVHPGRWAFWDAR